MFYRLAFIILLLLPYPASAVSPDTETQDTLSLPAGKPIHVDAFEARLAVIRQHGWQGRYDEAERLLGEIGPEHDHNADVVLLRATIAYYRRDYARAESLYRDVLTEYPDYADASDGLKRVERARSAPENLSWRLDAGYEYSRFSQSTQPEWNQEFVQVGHVLGSRRTVLHGKITRYEQFSHIDSEYELGIDHSFGESLTGYAYASATPHADFRPDWRLAGGGQVRVPGSASYAPVWLTLDSRYDAYDALDVWNLNPGIRLEFLRGWAFAFRKICVEADQAKTVYGEDYRLDGTVVDGLRFYLGYANAPETVAGITINTESWFGGMAWDVSELATVRFGYTRDDRENTYVREVVSASVSYRF